MTARLSCFYCGNGDLATGVHQRKDGHMQAVRACRCGSWTGLILSPKQALLTLASLRETGVVIEGEQEAAA